MKAIIGFFALALSVCTLAPAATTTNTTLTVNATGTASTTSVTAAGTAILTNIGNGTFSGTLPLSGISGANVIASFTITLSGGTLTGTLTLPLTLLEGLIGGATSAGTGSAAVTGGTGSYSGASGSFPSVAGTGMAVGSGFSLTFTGAGSITIGGAAPPPTATPTIAAVLDAGSYTANIAQGSIFVVKGTNLSASGLSQFGFPLPTSSNGVQIAFTPTSGGAVTSAYLVYLCNSCTPSGVNQLAAILPSALATGAYNVTVTNNNGVVSAPFAVTVVQRKPELVTQDGSGNGLVVVQNYISPSETDVDRFTTGTANNSTISPAKPGQTSIAWATGLGPVTTGDNTAAPLLNFLPTLNVQVIVGGVSITPTFAGRAPGLAGEDQINFVLPSNVPTGCTVPFQVSVNGVLSNPTFLSIASSVSASACTAPGLTAAQLQNLDQGGTLTQGSFTLTQSSIAATLPSVGAVTEKSDSAGGSFTQFTGYQLASAVALISPSGGCQILPPATSSQSALVFSGGTNLDAGAIALTGPSGSNLTNQPLAETSNTYNLNIGIEASGITLPPGSPGVTNATIVPGAYTLKGAGGKDVGPFSASINLGSPLTITGGLPTSVTRSAGLTLNWTGGNSTDFVYVIGGAGPTANSTTFLCTTTAGAATVTVPASILNQLPAVTAAAIAAGTATGFLAILSGPSPTSGNGLFSAALTAGGSINSGIFSTLLGIAAMPAYQ